MTDPRPAYLVGAPGPLRDRAATEVDALSPRTFDGVDAFVEAGPAPGITYLVGEGLPGDAVLRAVEHMATGRGEWTPVLVGEEEGELVARTVSLGYQHPLAETVGAAAGGETTALIELRGVLEQISRSRHDINNPLTSALAESQLLLMDVPAGSELREPVQTVLEQLRRIRDLVSATVHLRPLE